MPRLRITGTNDTHDIITIPAFRGRRLRLIDISVLGKGDKSADNTLHVIPNNE